jgi:hypothetical protein
MVTGRLNISPVIRISLTISIESLLKEIMPVFFVQQFPAIDQVYPQHGRKEPQKSAQVIADVTLENQIVAHRKHQDAQYQENQ